MDFPAEPFRIKMIERVKRTTREERERLIREAGYNIFAIPADSIYVDLLTDSGTSAMSDQQWAGLMLGDESYAGSRNFYRFEQAVRDLTGYKHVIPTHQGRMAEHLLFASVLSPGLSVPNNIHFDTTRANVQQRGAEAVDLVGADGLNPTLEKPFKGNMDLDRLDQYLAANRARVPLVMITVTNNSGGGQPVSMENIRGAREITKRHGVPLFFDACRFAENSWFIREREAGYAGTSVRDIAKEMFSLGDGCTMSAKKDALVNIGGFLALNNDEWTEKITNHLILVEGFPTYGGLAGRDLEAIARGLEEVTDEDYLAFRIGQVRFLGELLTQAGVPIVRPTGGHAVYIDAKVFLPHVPQSEFPGQSLVVELYRQHGVRAVEVGSLMFAEKDPRTGVVKYPALELVRLAIPRRVYTTMHMKYVADAVIDLFTRREELAGLRIVHEAPVLRHFTARLEPIVPALR
ncbi:MAG: tryptophanase [Candidatus Eisenbacteria bacterium]|nr:tryptophanase [Candidatus Eisenbacteria bacterium]